MNEKRVSELLRELGVPCHLKGFFYIQKAIMLIGENPELLEHMTKELYPAVAESFDTTPQRVERAIRHAIELIFEEYEPGDDLLFQIFRNTKYYKRGRKPTNSCFIATIVEYFKYI